MSKAYFDTSYLAKMHFREAGTAEVMALADTLSTVSCSIHGRVEFAAVGHRKMRENVASLALIRAIANQLNDATQAAAILWLPLTPPIYARAECFFLKDTPTTFLRAADALHLSCAAENGFTEIYSNDRHLLAAAPLFGLRGINIISP